MHPGSMNVEELQEDLLRTVPPSDPNTIKLGLLIEKYKSICEQREKARANFENCSQVHADLQKQLAQRLRDELGEVLHAATADGGY